MIHAAVSRWPRSLIAGAALLFFAAALGVGCRPTTTALAEPSRVEVIKTPNGGIQPQAVLDGAGTAHLVYLKGDPKACEVLYQRRAAGQSSWSEPLRVNSQSGSALAVGTIRGAHLAVGKANRVHVVWYGSAQAGVKGPGGGAPLLFSRLNDAGIAFEPQRNLMQFTTMLDGGASIAADPAGGVYVAWHAGDGQTEGEGNRRLWIATSRDEGKSFGREIAAWPEPTGACACCSTKALVDRNGTLYVMYRSAAATVNRDMYLLFSRDRGKTFEGKRLDGWKVGTCPMSSETLVEGPSAVLAGWETAGQVSFALIAPATRKASAPIPAPGSADNRKHPALAVNAAGEMLLTWTEGTAWNRGGSLAWQLYDRAGKPVGRTERVERGIPVWGLATAIPRRDGGFTIIH
jgi:hypothetical protein